MKAALIIEMPENCDKCGFSELGYDIVCTISDCSLPLEHAEAYRHENCPLIALNDMEYSKEEIEQMNLKSYREGWDACFNTVKNAINLVGGVQHESSINS